MAGTGNVDHVQIILLDHTIEVNIDEVLSGNCAPVTYDLLLDVLFCERFSEQRIVEQIKLAC